MKTLFLLPVLYLIYKMFSFPPNVEAKIVELDSAFALRVRLFFLLVKLLLGIDMVIVSGRRTAAQQMLLHKADSRNPAPAPGHPDSHMLGLAVDINGYKDGNIVLLKGSSPTAWSGVVSLAHLVGLRWGGNFNGYPDNNHFDGL